MKHLLLLLLVVLTYFSSHAQNDSIKNIGFKLHFPADSLSMTGVDFTKEKPECEFELKGKRAEAAELPKSNGESGNMKFLAVAPVFVNSRLL